MTNQTLKQPASVVKPRLVSYPTGVASEIEPEFYPTLVALLEDCVQRFPYHHAFKAFGDTLNYADLDRYSHTFASYLQQSLSLTKGERIAIMMPNILQYPFVLFGALRAGLVVVNTNPLCTPSELARQLNDAKVHTVVLLENFAHLLARCIDETAVRNVLITRVGDMSYFPKSALMNFAAKHIRREVPPYDIPGQISLSRALSDGNSCTFERIEIHPDDLALLDYEGGTAGAKKAAVLTHRNIVANMEQVHAWIRPYVTEGSEIVITATPFCNIFSLTANCLAFMRIGGLNLLIPDPRNMRAFVRALRGVRFTAISGANTLFSRLLNAPGFEKINFSSLKLSLAGGTAVQKATADRWAATTGSKIIETYGLTGTSPVVCVNPQQLDAYTGCIGLPVPSTEVSIRNEQQIENEPDSGADRSQHEVG